ncbi:MAG: DtxR family transcriptional regulator [Fibrobacterota bacterium]
MSSTDQLSSSLEDYLEAILELVDRQSVARVKNISDLLGVKRSSVTVALRNLSERGLVHYSPYSVITLTEKGDRIARCISCKHKYLSLFFRDILAVDRERAEDIACRMEHGFDSEVFVRFRAFYDYIKENMDISQIHRAVDDLCSSGLNGCECGAISLGEEGPLLSSLADCREGTQGVVTKISASSGEQHALGELGIQTGLAVSVQKRDLGGRLITLGAAGFRVSLDMDRARAVLVEVR